MFEEFKEKKFNEYLSLVHFPDGRINILKLRNYKLPPFIINFFKCSYPKNTTFIAETEFEKTLRKAIIFNINYIIKPKSTLIKFIFGEVETRPSEYIKQKLRLFQFYNYYISQIEDFINMNNPLVISKENVEVLIDEINDRILQEISISGYGDTQRLNLIKLLYYYFLELTENNPINIKLPKKILSVFFSDKGFIDIKNRIDSFFSDEIFIQEAIELMSPVRKDSKLKSDIKKPDGDDLDEKTLKELVDKAKTSLLNNDSLIKDVKIIQPIPLGSEIVSSDETKNVITDIRDLQSEPIEEVELLDKKVDLDESIFSEDTDFQEQIEKAVEPEALSEGEKKVKVLNEIFCEETYRKKIVRKLFRRNEDKFKEAVIDILNTDVWLDAIPKIEKLFDLNKINYYSPEAVKFVDLLEAHFVKSTETVNKKTVTNN